MRRIIMVLTIAALMGAMMATSGASASAQSPCPPTGPSGGPATLVSADEPLGAGFVCLDEEAQEFFCPPDFELWQFRNPGSDPAFVSECVQPSSASDGSETGEWQQAEPEGGTPAGSVCDTVGGGKVVINGYQVC
jgi:hypothetical protein